MPALRDQVALAGSTRVIAVELISLRATSKIVDTTTTIMIRPAAHVTSHGGIPFTGRA